MAILQKRTLKFAHHLIPLECDIYDAPDYPDDTPVLLFFFSGGLVSGSRAMVPPWLVQVSPPTLPKVPSPDEAQLTYHNRQTCLRRKWPLLSPDYRLLPQAKGEDLLQDAQAAFAFAQSYGGRPTPRRVIIAGASAGFVLAALIAHNLPTTTPSPLALLSITGIPTFQHPFFSSSRLIPPDPIAEDDVAQFLSLSPGDMTVGRHPWDQSAIFHLSWLLPSGMRNASFDPQHPPPPPPGNDGDPLRGMLYDYFLYENLFPDLVGTAVDPGFDWAQDTASWKLERWPMTIMIQGDADDDVDPDVCRDVASKLGRKAVLCVAEGKGHLFEKAKFLEDVESEEGLAAVTKAIAVLDEVVGGGT